MSEHVRRAVVEMAYDNGVIHRDNTEEDVVNRVMKYLEETIPHFEMSMADAELGRMTDEDFETVTCGEEGIIQVSPTLEKVLQEAFDAL